MLPTIGVALLVVLLLSLERTRAWWRSNEWRRVAQRHAARRAR